MTQSPAVRLVTEMALANKGFISMPPGGSDGQALIRSGSGVAWTATSGLVSPSIIAPPPSGGDDTAILQPLLNQAQSSGGTLILQKGLYQANLTTQAMFQQPLVVGQGRYVTAIQSVVATTAAVKFRGGSGTLAGGGLRTLQLRGNGAGVGLEYNGCGGVDSMDVDIQNFAEGLRFNNENGTDWTEFDTFQGSIEGCPISVRYKTSNGTESFHGSGLVGNTVVNIPASATTVVQVDPGAFPYNAPMSATFFSGPGTSGQALITNSNTGRMASFYGNIRVEGQFGNLGVGRKSFLAGTASVLGQGNGVRLGSLYLVDKAYYNGGNTFAFYRPVSRDTAMTAGTTTVFPDDIGSCLIQIDLVAANYHYSYLLHCWQSPYDPTGVVTVVANPKALNQAGFGAPTFGWSNYGLTVTNGSYSSAVRAHVTASPLTQNAAAGDNLGQF